jgi:demethylmenaquinone methyltransferase/2-methoxy-6-polyprenyl-1,4-benzoquinol methylase
MAIESKTVSFGYQDVDEDAKVGKVGDLFSKVATNYDLMNDAMTGGTHRLWKDRFVRRVKPKQDEEILDMAGGTGDIAFRMVDSGAHITVADINADMLAAGVERAVEMGEDRLVWSEQNAEELSFPDAHFDAFTMVFGIRNVTHIDKVLEEAYRTLRFGGRFYCMEFSQTRWPGFDKAYELYSHKILPKVGKLISDDEDSYRYLAESIDRFPPMEKFEAMIKEAGFSQTKVEPMMGGLVCIHSGWKV